MDRKDFNHVGSSAWKKTQKKLNKGTMLRLWNPPAGLWSHVEDTHATFKKLARCDHKGALEGHKSMQILTSQAKQLMC